MSYELKNDSQTSYIFDDEEYSLKIEHKQDKDLGTRSHGYKEEMTQIQSIFEAASNHGTFKWIVTATYTTFERPELDVDTKCPPNCELVFNPEFCLVSKTDRVCES